MKPFTYERARTPAEAAAAAARDLGAKFIAGGTNLLDLMKLQIEAPTHLIDVNGLALDKVEATPEGGLRIGALMRNTDLAADERVRPAAQQGDDGGQPAAAHPLPLLLRRSLGLQQARAGQRLRRAGGVQPRLRDPGRERELHRHPPLRHVRGAGRPGRRRRGTRCGRHPTDPADGVPPTSR